MKTLLLSAILALSNAAFVAQAQAKDHPIPRLVQTDGRYALFVDGAPYLMLGAQSNNSSDWPATLPKVWSAIEYLHANTLETPIYWEQFEPRPASTTSISYSSGSAPGRTAASTTSPSG